MNGFTVNLFGRVSEAHWEAFQFFLAELGLHASGNSESCWVENCEEVRPEKTSVSEDDRQQVAAWLRDQKEIATFEVLPIFSPLDVLDETMRETN